ncbi:GntR family transcriptional regulator [Rhodococcus sp. NPDC003382]|uniref:GntR family transcriptional regulator n=1 Tax=unclassified Rhodococcus (in: high G+C Gram-positive bacteria) TaxID=192944 RepID=UPI0018CD9B23|nr:MULTISPECIES: GntR family transcriptional regulator [unclassified Rhodococcus (in: high G+C Gram-positive bacteria)]MBH0118080.1 GntR family transcriptional regulator [Rhodococcus sp. CX]MCK8672954.1 GntR family transcriptional regulator [Rhodococcus sp. HM1]
MPPRHRSALLAQFDVDRPGRPQQAILDELRRVILSGAAPPGTAIPVGEIAELFGVSRIPIREALKTLIGEGLVDHRQNGGYTVARLTAAEFREMYLVRETLETASLTAAVVHATEADHALARASHERLEQAVAEDDPVAYHRESRVFHMALTAPSRMHRLLHMLESAWNITEPVQPMVHVTAAHRAVLHADHGRMLDCFLARDVPGLLAAAETHNRRLDSTIETLPVDTGLLTREDIHFE